MSGTVNGLVLTRLLEELGIAKYLKEEQCNRLASPFLLANSIGWNDGKNFQGLRFTSKYYQTKINLRFGASVWLWRMYEIAAIWSEWNKQCQTFYS